VIISGSWNLPAADFNPPQFQKANASFFDIDFGIKFALWDLRLKNQINFCANVHKN